MTQNTLYRPNPAVAGVIGWPIAHSQSPMLHRFWLEACQINGDYSRFPVHPSHLEQSIKALPALGFRGVNVTVPHKQAVIPFLDSIDPLAEKAGAVNIVSVEEDGHLKGYNSDIPGFMEALQTPMQHQGEGLRKAFIIGAGGAARAVALGLTAAGFTCQIVNRNPEKARALARDIGALRGDLDFHSLEDNREPEFLLQDGELGLIVNATTLGMTGQPPLDISLAKVDSRTLVYDVVYAPLETPLLKAAKARGLKTIDGMSMLIGQGAVAFEIFYGCKPPRDQDQALRALLTSRK
ncbi:MAG: shikimate dehydrogenase [Zymomonas mobilis subsp. pomaceae]|uniref:Shikimate dehydrogenase (NADP(+)) n=1 Tax=Zymomonas mobilis subsp. pomaceae (strain ATCC 29192 / DSM 22645 / JCM 10191 / CCUG 17912 / NBRC 13757 / NCIMB 11200 / NRRL B-4491 / Barker I) TaxID=579138 RepID=F8ETV7_ZYMMT|nr:shikimate dehydrogenase [Zymomonas mobilis]AEI38054.1 shikimate 5-dehydrogenase [Zymomonas mobilis subsp. pomaceae ATCC 29192]MDX5949420.1 shikimate dehydrogenase [Zymomonas mobilis subsp. pomaceae]GEB89163.1 shikimate dehydrogenase (NADP(+)) [Zymomonas mobilis subsp. pomaceae]